MDRLGVPVTGKIPPDEAMSPGRALARLSDLGWGQRLRELLREDAPVSPDLLRACVGVLAEWGWAQRPPASSRCRHAATRSSSPRSRPASPRSGGSRCWGRSTLEHGGPTGEPGGNSAFRLAGVWERVVVGPALAEAVAGLAGPVLLVDDLVSSRWTLTVAGRALRMAGAPGVLPFALAVDG